jgi:hypothetical protein
VLANLNCNVTSTELWTHNTRVATGIPIRDEKHISNIKRLLCNVLTSGGTDDIKSAHMISCLR